MTSFGGPGRGSHQAALDASLAVFEARQAVSGLLGAWGAGSVSFALNATMAPQHRYRRFAACGRRRGDHGRLHNSVLRPPIARGMSAAARCASPPSCPMARLTGESYERALSAPAWSWLRMPPT